MSLAGVLAVIQERSMNQTSYFGVKALKSPLDHWVYQEIIFEIKPDVILEIGNAYGGSALSLAHLCDILGHGKVIGLDLSHAKVPSVVKEHPRITFIEGDACELFANVRKLIGENESVLIIEDSSHTYENTLRVLRTYAPLVKAGGYFIVEDGICHHGLTLGPKPGPYEAVETFIEESQDFEIDRARESFLITWNPKGYLRRRSGEASSTIGSSHDREADGGMSWSEIVKLFVPPIITKTMRRLRV